MAKWLRGDLLKKGQLQTQETMLVIFIFIVLLFVGLIIFFRFNNISIQTEREEYENYKFDLLISVFPSMAEVSCSELGVEGECIDVSKLEGFSSVSSDYFSNKKMTISINDVYLKDKSWNIFDNKPEKYDSFRNISTPVALYYPVEEKYSVGVLKLGWYK